jgi:hypothetical protein
MRRTALALVAALALGAAGAAVLVGQSTDPSAAPPDGPRAIAGGLTRAGKQAGWRGVYPGRSTTKDVTAAMGAPAATEQTPDGLTRMIYPPDPGLKFNSVYVDARGLVKTVGWAFFEEPVRVPARVLWQALGEPKMVSPFSFVKQGAIYQWEEAAVWGVVDRPTDATITLVFYDPAEPPRIPVPSGPPRQ